MFGSLTFCYLNHQGTDHWPVGHTWKVMYETGGDGTQPQSYRCCTFWPLYHTVFHFVDENNFKILKNYDSISL